MAEGQQRRCRLRAFTLLCAAGMLTCAAGSPAAGQNSATDLIDAVKTAADERSAAAAVTVNLLDLGADVNAQNGLGWTPLMVAKGVFVANTEKAWPETVALLTDLGGR